MAISRPGLTSSSIPSATWKDIERVRGIWPGNLIIKGVLDPEDARFAARSGAERLIVSNHGGRQLDGVASSIRMTAAHRRGGWRAASR